jgi:hypothetical protein
MSTQAVSRALPRASAVGVAAQTVTGAVIAAAAAGLTVYLANLTTIKGLAVVVVVAGSLWLASTRRTGLALALIMLYLGLLDGYLKLATGSNYVTFIRDVLLYALVVGLLVRASVQGTRLEVPPLSGWVIAFVVLVLVQLLNPQDGTLVHSLAGVRQHLEFVPLFFLTFAFVRTKKALRIFVILLAVIAALNGLVGWIQFNETPAQFAAWGPGYTQRVLGEGGFQLAGRTAFVGGQDRTRPFGLGSDAGAGGVFGAFALGGIVALASLGVRRRYVLLAVVAAIGATAAIITSQGRGVIVGGVIILLAYGLLTATTRNRVATLVGVAIAGLVAFFVAQAIVSSAGSSSLRYQGLDPGSILQTTAKARGASITAIPHNFVTYPLGAGLGVSGPATGAQGASQLAGNVNAESEFSFLIVEGGIPGMVVLTGFTVSLLVLGLRRCRHERDREACILLAAVIAPIAGIFALFFPSALTASVPAGPYLWAAGGVISYWLVALPAARRRESAATARSPAVTAPSWQPLRPQRQTAPQIAAP